jgi:hypothetical protein
MEVLGLQDFALKFSVSSYITEIVSMKVLVQSCVVCHTLYCDMGVNSNYISDFGITVVIVGIGHASEPYSVFDC